MQVEQPGRSTALYDIVGHLHPKFISSLGLSALCAFQALVNSQISAERWFTKPWYAHTVLQRLKLDFVLCCLCECSVHTSRARMERCRLSRQEALEAVHVNTWRHRTNVTLIHTLNHDIVQKDIDVPQQRCGILQRSIRATSTRRLFRARMEATLTRLE
jgi:hypothetical protein